MKKGRQVVFLGGLCFGGWWSWGDSNPRPRTFHAQFYMLSGLI